MEKNTWIGILVVVVIVLGVGYFLKSGSPIDESKKVTTLTETTATNSPEKAVSASISGKLIFTGLKPKSDAEGKVVLLARKAGEPEFKKIKDLALADLESWTWSGAESDGTYELQAYVEIRGQKIKSSPVVAVTAPAADENLSLDVSADDLPADIREKGIREAQSAKVVSGTIALQGYVPAGSVLRVSSKLAAADDSTYKIVSAGLAARDGVVWSWSDGVAGTKYKYHAELVDKQGTVIGSSDHVVVSTPAENQKLIVVSTATAPIVTTDTAKATETTTITQSNQQTGTISGTVKLNGSVKDQTQIAIQYRKLGEKNFQTIQTVDAQSGVKWSWNAAGNGVGYEVRAVLLRKDKEIARSRTTGVTAPARNIELKINSGISFDAPSSMPKVTSCDKNGKNYKLKLSIPSVDKANMYWVQVGERSGKADIYDEKLVRTSSNKDFTVEVKIDNNDTNYARYGYAYCENCGDEQNYSDFSDSLSFSCSK